MSSVITLEAVSFVLDKETMDKIRPSPRGEESHTSPGQKMLRWSGMAYRAGAAWSSNQKRQGERGQLDIILIDELLPGKPFPVILWG